MKWAIIVVSYFGVSIVFICTVFVGMHATM